jgi:hypothetical protein
MKTMPRDFRAYPATKDGEYIVRNSLGSLKVPHITPRVVESYCQQGGAQNKLLCVSAELTRGYPVIWSTYSSIRDLAAVICV